MSIKTPFGVTQRENVNKIVLQGEVLGPLQCSVLVDTFGKECMTEDKLLYNYWGDVKIPPLSMIDDIVAVSECGLEAVDLNAYLNTKTNLKKLQFGVDKCVRMHVGCDKPFCPDLFIDQWKLKKVEEARYDVKNLQDVSDTTHMMNTSEEQKYLGFQLSSKGGNKQNIAMRRCKGLGIVRQITAILEDIPLGHHKYKIAVVLRNALLINSILYNSEIWYSPTTAELETLEQIDEMVFRGALSTPRTTPRPFLYLEMGCLPIRVIIKTRRLMYLHYLLNEDEDSLIHSFFQSQQKSPLKGDWCLNIQEDLSDFQIQHLSYDDIQHMSKLDFKTLINNSATKYAFKYLVALQKSMTKICQIKYTRLEIQPYLSSPIFSNREIEFLFQAKSRMLNFRTNYRGSYSDVRCPLCSLANSEDTHRLLSQNRHRILRKC